MPIFPLKLKRFSASTDTVDKNTHHLIHTITATSLSFVQSLPKVQEKFCFFLHWLNVVRLPFLRFLWDRRLHAYTIINLWCCVFLLLKMRHKTPWWHKFASIWVLATQSLSSTKKIPLLWLDEIHKWPYECIGLSYDMPCMCKNWCELFTCMEMIDFIRYGEFWFCEFHFLRFF